MAQKQKPVLKIYCLSQPILLTEWRSLLSDKYFSALPFEPILTENAADADVVAWDGMISSKFERLLPRLLEILSGKTLLLVGEAQTLLKDHPYVRLFSAGDFKTVQLPGWSILPEELLDVLNQCYQAGQHV